MVHPNFFDTIIRDYLLQQKNRTMAYPKSVNDRLNALERRNEEQQRRIDALTDELRKLRGHGGPINRNVKRIYTLEQAMQQPGKATTYRLADRVSALEGRAPAVGDAPVSRALRDLSARIGTLETDRPNVHGTNGIWDVIHKQIARISKLERHVGPNTPDHAVRELTVRMCRAEDRVERLESGQRRAEEARNNTDALENGMHMHRLRDVENKVKSMAEVVGPHWKTAAGHLVTPKFMSDSHLTNVLDGNFGSHAFRQACFTEQARRNEDDMWSKRPNSQGNTNPTPRLRLKELESKSTVASAQISDVRNAVSAHIRAPKGSLRSNVGNPHDPLEIRTNGDVVDFPSLNKSLWPSWVGLLGSFPKAMPVHDECSFSLKDVAECHGLSVEGKGAKEDPIEQRIERLGDLRDQANQLAGSIDDEIIKLEDEQDDD